MAYDDELQPEDESEENLAKHGMHVEGEEEDTESPEDELDEDDDDDPVVVKDEEEDY